MTPSPNPEVLCAFSKQTIQIGFTASVDNLPQVTYETVLLDLAKWDQYWQQQPCNYVPANLSHFPRNCCKTDADYQQEIIMHQQKIQRWADELRTGGQVPAVCYSQTLVNNKLRIRQGRHRIAYFRHIGLPCFAAAIPQERLQQVQRNQLLFTEES